MSNQHRACGQTVQRDTERFRLLFTNNRPELPDDFSVDLTGQSIDCLIEEEIERLSA